MLAATLREAAHRFGDRTAYVSEAGIGLTYHELDLQSDAVARGLAERGLGDRDVLGLVLSPGLDYVVAYLAAAKLGVITAGVNDRLQPRERDVVLARAQPALVIAAPGLEPDRHDSIASSDAGGIVLPDLHEPGDPPPPLPPDPDRPVAIVFTSGTTGEPKGALYCESQLTFITDTDVGDAWGSGTKSYTGTSFAHLGFMTKLPGALRRGGTQVILSRWSPTRCLELVEREQLATVAGVPAQLALMLQDPDFDRYDLSSVQLLVTGGGPITPGVAEEARARFGAALATRYSCTEAGIGLGTAPDAPPEDAVVSVGRPHPAVELSLRDESGTEISGAVGEVCLRSPAVMRGYWRDEEATAAAFTHDGFVKTGDLGWIDDVGRLRLVGRAKEMYVRGGYNVHPVEVEAVLSQHPSVAAIAVVPRNDRVMGEIGVAVVVTRNAQPVPSLDELREFGATDLAKYKLPEALVTTDALPLTAMEKIDRRALTTQVADPRGDR